MQFDPDALLEALPMRSLKARLPNAPPPRLNWSLLPTTYNGFTPMERGRTGAIAFWLQEFGCMARPDVCAICHSAATQQHAEDYYAFERWIDVCAGCHGVLHKRFFQRSAWLNRLDRFAITADHWTRLVSPEPFDLAALLRSRGAREPPAANLAARLLRPSRRPRQNYLEMGIPIGGRLTHPLAPEQEVAVAGAHQLLWRGSLHSLTSLTRALTAEFHLPTSHSYWRVGGRTLDDIYDERYGSKG